MSLISSLADGKPLNSDFQLKGPVGADVSMQIAPINVEGTFHISLTQTALSYELHRDEASLAIEENLQAYLPLFAHKKEFEKYHKDGYFGMYLLLKIDFGNSNPSPIFLTFPRIVDSARIWLYDTENPIVPYAVKDLPITSDLSIASNKRYIKLPCHTFKSQWVLVKFKSSSPNYTYFSLSDEFTSVRIASENLQMFSISLMGCLTCFFYNIFVMIRLRRPDYFWYNLTVVVSILSSSAALGWTISAFERYIDLTTMPYNREEFWTLLAVAPPFFIAPFFIFFVCSMSNLKARWRALYFTVNGLAWMGIILGLFMLFLVKIDRILSIQMARATPILSLSTLVIYFYGCVKLRDRPSWIAFFGALSVAFFGHIYIEYQRSGGTGDSLASNALMIGIFIQLLILSIALADNIQSVNEKMTESLNSSNDKLTNLNATLEYKVEEKSRDIRSILEQIPEGIFRIKSEEGKLIIDDEFSNYLRILTGVEHPSGLDPMALIFAKSDLDKDLISQITTVLITSLGEPIYQWELNAHILPHSFNLPINAEARRIDAQWKAIVNEDGKISKILISLRDSTDLRELQEHAQDRANHIKMIGELASISKVRAMEFFEIAEELLRHESADSQPIMRSLHTLKGLARSYGFSQLVDIAHACEQETQAVGHSSAAIQESWNRNKSALFNVLNSYKKVNSEVLGRSVNLSICEVPRERLARVIAQAQKLTAKGSLLKNDSSSQTDLITEMVFLVEENLEKVLHFEIFSLNELARKLGKSTPWITFINDSYVVTAQAKAVLRKCFVHIFRNCMDHGLENNAERVTKGKPATGSITVRLEERGENIRIVIHDDGRGLNLNTLEEKARQWLPSFRSGSDNEVSQLIFVQGITTRSQVTEISGLGVGMDAVKSFLRQHDGDIEVELRGKRDPLGFAPFALVITLKSTNFLKPESISFSDHSEDWAAVS